MKQNIMRLVRKGLKRKTKMLASRKRIVRGLNVRERETGEKINTRRE